MRPAGPFLRKGTRARLRWRHYRTDTAPLGTIDLGKTKTGVPRAIPVHPTLAVILDEWWSAGWERTYCRPPTPDDLVVPTRNLTTRKPPEAQEALLQDLQALGLRPRRGHDLRRTFITLAQADGADRRVLETITHGPRGDIINLYTTFPWPVLCRELSKLAITLPAPSLPPQPPQPPSRYTAVTPEARARRRWLSSVTPSGIECARDLMKEAVGSAGGRDSAGIAVPKRGFVDPRCNECGERVSRLAGVAKNALMNGDFERVIAVLGELEGEREVVADGNDGRRGQRTDANPA